MNTIYFFSFFGNNEYEYYFIDNLKRNNTE